MKESVCIKFSFVTSILSLLCVSCASQKEAVAPDAQIRPSQALQRDAKEQGNGNGLSVGSGRAALGADGYFALFEKQVAGWNLLSVSTSRPPMTDLDRQELLYFSADLKQVQPSYIQFPKYGEGAVFLCDKGLLAVSLTEYSPCRSKLTRAASVALNVAAMAFMWPILATGTVAGQFVVDKDEVLAIIETTGTLERVKTVKVEAERERWLALYRVMFIDAKTSAQYGEFVQKYRDNDPDNLVQKASTRRNELAAKEAEDARQRQILIAKQVEAQAASQAEIRKSENEKRIRRVSEVENFRRLMKVETETNCGPVLEVRGSLVLIYFPVANYGNEHWLRRDQLFPAKDGCRFVNGGYQPPSL